nr:HAD-IC family P-type ATPase [Cypionkella sp.]
EHPLAAAVLEAAKGLVLPVVTGFEAVPGQGARGFIGEEPVAVGSARMFAWIDAALAGQAAAAQAEGKGVLFVARGDKVFGLIAVADPVKAQSRAAVSALRDMGISSVMVTGDSAATAQVVADGLGIVDVRAGILPEGKAEVIRSLGAGTGFVGDGINDAPALAQADVGIAMGSGSDVAIEAGDVVLMTGDPMGVVNAIALSRAVMRNIRQNLAWAFGYNVALIPIAAGVLVPFGGPQLSPMLGAGAMALSSVFVLSNALRLRRFKRL